ncbi:unnamed protein product [Orchesella dallaii]|uniref:Uncharacterized protein n=1 Tax=Orchesella dallaii TaxID=48710 RepID=A0ABP1R8A3_9HEXA
MSRFQVSDSALIYLKFLFPWPIANSFRCSCQCSRMLVWTSICHPAVTIDPFTAPIAAVDGIQLKTTRHPAPTAEGNTIRLKNVGNPAQTEEVPIIRPTRAETTTDRSANTEPNEIINLVHLLAVPSLAYRSFLYLPVDGPFFEVPSMMRNAASRSGAKLACNS